MKSWTNLVLVALVLGSAFDGWVGFAPQASEGTEKRGAPRAGDASELFARLEGQLREPRDPRWAYRAQDTLWDAYSPLVEQGGIRLVDVQCRRTLCRVALHAEPGVDPSRVPHAPWSGRSLFRQRLERDGSTTLVGYIAREGESLASLFAAAP
jgi:hypothetical protein